MRFSSWKEMIQIGNRQNCSDGRKFPVSNESSVLRNIGQAQSSSDICLHATTGSYHSLVSYIEGCVQKMYYKSCMTGDAPPKKLRLSHDFNHIAFASCRTNVLSLVPMQQSRTLRARLQNFFAQVERYAEWARELQCCKTRLFPCNN